MIKRIQRNAAEWRGEDHPKNLQALVNIETRRLLPKASRLGIGRIDLRRTLRAAFKRGGFG